jgi:pimeloyl-ACP methyl ester carboxylesterase
VDCRINDVAVHYVAHGTGVPVVGLHGAGVDHREIEVAVEAIRPIGDYRRIYPDLPGMGRTTATGLTGNDDVVGLLGSFIDRVAGGQALVIGHSYGAYLARGLAARRPDQVLGLAVVCPVAEHTTDVPDHHVVRHDIDAHDELDAGQRAGFDDYFVTRTRATARRYRQHVVPGTTLVDKNALTTIFGRWAIDLGSAPFLRPTLIMAGRCDSVVGYADAARLLEPYPHATLAVIDNAGHALMHERPELFTTLVVDWLARARPSDE